VRAWELRGKFVAAFNGMEGEADAAEAARGVNESMIVPLLSMYIKRVIRMVAA
jgi:hypothetical protein